MAIEWTGDPDAGETPSPAPGDDVETIAVIPEDDEDASAASITQPIKQFANNDTWIFAHGVWRDIAKTITAILTFSNKVILDGADGDENEAIRTTAVPDGDRKLLWQIAIGDIGGTPSYLRLYSMAAGTGGGLELVANASWDVADLEWDLDAAAHAWRAQLRRGAGGGFTINRYSGASPFDEVDWVSHLSSDNDDKSLTVAGNVVTPESVVATKDLKGRHLVGSGSAPTGAVGAGYNLGVGGAITITGHDVAHRISIAVGTGSAGTSGELAVITFANHAGAGVPVIHLFPSNADARNLGIDAFYAEPNISGGNYVSYSIFANVAIADSTTYGLTAIVVGA